MNTTAAWKGFAVWGLAGVGRRDAALKPTWTYSRRPAKTHTVNPATSNDAV